jgi:hypothetical protein
MFRPDPKSEPRPKKPKTPLKRTGLKRGYITKVSPSAIDSLNGSEKVKESKPVQVWAKIKRTKLKKKFRKPTGELALMKIIYEETGGRCEITGEKLPFDVWSFAHLLGKKAYPKFRLKKENVALVKREIHYIYDNDTEENLLKKYPNAKVMYERKQLLKTEYNVH